MARIISRISIPETPFFVGREKECTRLENILAEAITREVPRIVLVEGEYGAGKTALINHVLRSARDHFPQLIIGRGQFTDHQGGYDAWIEALLGIIDLGRKDRIILENAGDFLLKVAPAWIALIPIVGEVSSALITTISELKKVSHPGQTFSTESIFTQFANLLTDVSQKRPLILFLDDIQWANEGSLRLLSHLGSKLHNRPILLIATYRPVEALEMGEQAQLFKDICANLLEKKLAIKISLETGLDQYGIQVKEYIQKRYPNHIFPADLSNLVQDRTRGHAIYVEQLFSFWEETGVINRIQTPEGDSWYLAKPVAKEGPLPEHLGEIIDARIRHLSQELQEILKYAATEGEVFTAQVIAEALGLNEPVLAREMASLEQKYHLVEYKDTRELEVKILDLYQFLHSFFRDKIYEELSEIERRNYHKEIGFRLENIYLPRTAPVAVQLSTHFARARLWEKAARYALEAAIFEGQRGSWFEATRLCQQGLEYLGETRENAGLRLSFIEQLGDGYYHLGRYTEAEKYYRQTLQEISQNRNLPEREAGLCEKLADVCWYTRKFNEISSFIEQGMKALITSPHLDEVIGLRLEAQKAWLNIHEGENEEAIAKITEILERCQKFEPTHEIEALKIRLYNWLGISYSNLCNFHESSEAYRQSIDIAERIGESSLQLTSLNNLAYDLLIQDEWDESEILINRALELAIRVGDNDNEVNARSNRVGILLARQKPQEAVRELNEMLQQVGEDSWQSPFIYADLALAHLSLSRFETAHREVLKAIALVREAQDDIETLAYTLSVLAKVETAKGHVELARQFFNEAKDLYFREGNVVFLAQVCIDYAQFLVQLGDPSRAKELLQTALEIYCKLGFNKKISECKKVLQSLPEL